MRFIAEVLLLSAVALVLLYVLLELGVMLCQR